MRLSEPAEQSGPEGDHPEGVGLARRTAKITCSAREGLRNGPAPFFHAPLWPAIPPTAQNSGALFFGSRVAAQRDIPCAGFQLIDVQITRAVQNVGQRGEGTIFAARPRAGNREVDPRRRAVEPILGHG